jgi:hypothetical protein
MSPVRKHPKRLTAQDILFGDWPTVDVSGDSGMGKSCLLVQLILSAMRTGVATLVIDPAGDLVDDVEAHLPALPAAIRDRVVLVRAADPDHTVPFNPLQSVRTSAGSLVQRAWQAVKVEHTTMQVLAAWGELEQGVQGRPRLWKHLHLWFSTLAACGLGIPDVEHFFLPRSRIYTALTNLAPTAISRQDLAALNALKPAEAEELMSSAKTRLQGMLNNPFVVAPLSGGMPGVPAFNAYQAIQDGLIVLVHLGRGDDVLRDMDVQILANLWLSEFLFAAYSTPRPQRRHLAIFLDELNEFEASAPLLTRLARFGRKYLTRAVCAHQGTQFFVERTDSRLLNALVGQSGVRVLFRHTNPSDRRYFAEVLTRPNPWAVKHTLSQEQQYQDGNELMILNDESESWSDAQQQGSSAATGTSDQLTDSTGASQSRQSPPAAQERTVVAATQGQARARGSSQTDTASESQTQTHGGGRTRRQVLVPRMRSRKIVTSVQFLTRDEHLGLEENTIADLRVGQARVNFSGQPPLTVQFRLAQPPFIATPKFAAKKLAAVRAAYLAQDCYRNPTEVLATHERFSQEFAEAFLAARARQPEEPESPLPATPAQPPVQRPAVLPADSPFAEGF